VKRNKGLRWQTSIKSRLEAQKNSPRWQTKVARG